MLFDRPITLLGPPSHTEGTLREWDYDRGGSAQQVICECEWHSPKRWDYERSALTDYAEHIAVSEFVWRGANTGELLTFLEGLPLDAIAFYLRHVDQNPGVTLYKQFGRVSLADPHNPAHTAGVLTEQADARANVTLRPEDAA